MRHSLGNPNQNVLAEVPKSSKKSNEKPKNLKKSQEEPKNLYPFAPIRTETNSGAGQFTGYSLTDQHILSPINPKYERLIFFSDLQRFTPIVLKLKTCKPCVLNFTTIGENLTKSVVILFWINWW